MLSILNLRRYHVLSTREDTHDYHIAAETANPPTQCIHCGSDNLVGGGRQEIMIRDHLVHAKRVAIYVSARRLHCRECNKTFTESLPDVAEGKRMTARLYQWIAEQSLKRTFTSIAEDVGCTEGTIRSVFREYIAKLEETVIFETPEWMGIDEIHIIKKPRLVVSNIEHNKVVNILSDRNKTTVSNYLFRLPNRNSIKCVTMDMWLPYKNAVNAVLPSAFIVVDKFHVVRMANQSLEVVRKSIREDLTTKQRRGLMHDRFFLLKRESELKPFERLTLESWTRNFPVLGEAYQAKEDFLRIYDHLDISDALAAYDTWQSGLSLGVATAFKPLITAVKNWRTEIFAYFDHPVTNAYTESLNNLIRCVNRIGRGYSFDALRAKILFTKGAHKVIQPTPKFERRDPYAIGRMTHYTPTVSAARTINYGVDTSTLLRLLEESKV
ncbi:ISL3 family transposase [Trichlorobacter lovleyi]|uniref:Transposase IS204/IS1001/IS1096/IS1165 family protein n=1 Tax=Trichlorobacter lovleyi (strain ATCC BAA-1151 / DSM 17278 / SZ) TaxID=398767 RepID=B3EAX3_TRIL1|nr:ISL3 family transposase [Trichlorobacter lovleyi]ACD93957.1 transposase IS204/IS1001/IS1096/IS1165 family protein [Trichlorobacter lovleyi SZ]